RVTTGMDLTIAIVNGFLIAGTCGLALWLWYGGHITVGAITLATGLVGFAIVKLGEKVTEARKLVGQMSDIMIQVTRFVLEVTPIGTFGL
ncbi:hypothetical protein ABGA94_07945, partial [Stenotrophomonas sp. 3diitr2024]